MRRKEIIASGERYEIPSYARIDLVPVRAEGSHVHDLDGARTDPAFAELIESVRLPNGRELRVPGPALPSIGRTPPTAAPALGEHTATVLREFGFDDKPDEGVH